MTMLRILILLSCYTTGIVFSWTESSITNSQKRNSKYHQRRPLDMASDVAPISTYEVSDVKILGVCGGIGSGKSAACKILVSELNCLAHIDSDSIAHTVYEPNSAALNDIINEFGSDLLLASGEIDRKKLGSIVFADIADMKKLERIVWPHVKTKIMQQIETMKLEFTTKGNDKIPVIVVEAAVLLDAEWNDILDGIWVVTVSQPTAIRRLQGNRNLSVEESEKRIQAQSSRRGIGNLQQEVDDGIVSAVIPNDSSLEALKACLLAKLNDPNAWYRER
jgi:dephospho-CoA kinase